MTTTSDFSDTVRRLFDYPDDRAQQISADEIIRRGRGVRHRQVAVGTTMVLIAVAISTTVALHLAGQPGTAVPKPADNRLDRVLQQSIFTTSPPEGSIAIVDESVAWTSVAWISRELFCAGTVAMSAPDAALECVPMQLGTGGDVVVVQAPLFQAMPPPETQHDRVLVIGLVPGSARTVRLVFRGSTVTVHVHAVGAGVALGAYAAWLPLHGATSYSEGDFSSVTARDADGWVVGQLAG